MSKLNLMKKLVGVLVAGVVVAGFASPVRGERIRDLTRLKNEEPNELVGMGLVLGLNGTGDGGDFLPAMRPLKEMMKRFDNPIMLEKELKNAKNVAIVSLSMKIPAQGAHKGEKLDVRVSGIACKSLAGGQLLVVPMLAPTPNAKVILAWASGDMVVEDPAFPQRATIREGGVLIEDVLPEEVNKQQFTLVLAPNAASQERAAAIADQINAEVSAQTGGKAIAVAVDATSVVVNIPKAEQANVTPFVARVMALPLPALPEPALVRINNRTKSIVFTDEVEISPTTVNLKTMVINIGKKAENGVPGSNGSLKELEEAFNLLKVSGEDRIAVVKELKKANAIKGQVLED